MFEINWFEINWSETMKLLWDIIRRFWWVWAMALGLELIIVFLERFFDWLEKWLDKRRTQKWLEKHKTLEDWKKVSGKEFEKITATIFEKLGYKTKIIGGAGDRGIDVIAKKDGKRYFIQCKQMNKVSPSMLRDFYGSIADRLKEGEKGFFVTTGEFTQEGKEFAQNKPIELINGLELEKMAKEDKNTSGIY